MAEHLTVYSVTHLFSGNLRNYKKEHVFAKVSLIAKFMGPTFKSVHRPGKHIFLEKAGVAFAVEGFIQPHQFTHPTMVDGTLTMAEGPRLLSLCDR